MKSFRQRLHSYYFDEWDGFDRRCITGFWSYFIVMCGMLVFGPLVPAFIMVFIFMSALIVACLAALIGMLVSRP